MRALPIRILFTSCAVVALSGVSGARQPHESRPEEALIAVLRSDAPRSDKARACQQLAAVGTAEAVPALAGLLGDEVLAAYARIGLEPIPDPSVDLALREATTRLEGTLLIGVINSLGVRRDGGAVQRLIELLRDPTAGVAPAALSALGRIGDGAARAVIRETLSAGPEHLVVAAADAALVCAGESLARNRRAEAAELYEAISKASVPAHVRASATYGVILARESGALPLLLAQLRSHERAMVEVALRATRELSDPEVTSAVAGVLGDLRPPVQVLTIRALVDRDDPSVREVVRPLTRSDSALVRAEAIRALGIVGDASCVELLVRELTGDHKEVAFAALRELRADGVNRALIDLLSEPESVDRTELIRLLSTRQVVAATPALLELTSTDDGAVAVAAYKALGTLAGRDRIPHLLDGLVREREPRIAALAGRALLDVARRTAAEDALEDLVHRELQASHPSSTVAELLGLLGGMPSGRSLAALSAAADHAEASIRDAAVRQLWRWSGPEALPVLKRIVLDGGDETHRVLAMRGYVRLLESFEGSMAERAALVREAMAWSDRSDFKKLVLSGMTRVPHPSVFELAVEAAGDEAVRAEAELALIGMAPGVAGSAPESVRVALIRIADHGASSTSGERAQEILRCIDGFDDHVLGWQVSPVFVHDDEGYAALLHRPFEPEAFPDRVEWRVMPVATDPQRPWLVDLGRLHPERGNAVVYLRTWIHVPGPSPARLEIGSDDGVKVWIDGVCVHSRNAARGVTPGEDLAEVSLRAGWNELLVKVTQNTGPWGACLRLRSPRGTAIPGLRVDAFHEPTTGVERTSLFDGVSLDGWRGPPSYWSVQDESIVGHSAGPVPRNEFIWSEARVDDFYLSVHVKQEPPALNAGIQFRSMELAGGEAQGYQADIGQGLWGRLYHENGRGRLDWTGRGEKAVFTGDWNHYEILAVGPYIWTAINGQLSVALHDPDGERAGLIAFQIHAGGPQTVRYKFPVLVHEPSVALVGWSEEELKAAARSPTPPR